MSMFGFRYWRFQRDGIGGLDGLDIRYQCFTSFTREMMGGIIPPANGMGLGWKGSSACLFDRP
jgi:hypothetical protein